MEPREYIELDWVVPAGTGVDIAWSVFIAVVGAAMFWVGPATMVGQWPWMILPLAFAAFFALPSFYRATRGLLEWRFGAPAAVTEDHLRPQSLRRHGWVPNGDIFRVSVARPRGDVTVLMWTDPARRRGRPEMVRAAGGTAATHVLREAIRPALVARPWLAADSYTLESFGLEAPEAPEQWRDLRWQSVDERLRGRLVVEPPVEAESTEQAAAGDVSASAALEQPGQRRPVWVLRWREFLGLRQRKLTMSALALLPVSAFAHTLFQEGTGNPAGWYAQIPEGVGRTATLVVLGLLALAGLGYAVTGWGQRPWGLALDGLHLAGGRHIPANQVSIVDPRVGQRVVRIAAPGIRGLLPVDLDGPHGPNAVAVMRGWIEDRDDVIYDDQTASVWQVDGPSRRPASEGVLTEPDPTAELADRGPRSGERYDEARLLMNATGWLVIQWAGVCVVSTLLARRLGPSPAHDDRVEIVVAAVVGLVLARQWFALGRAIKAESGWPAFAVDSRRLWSWLVFLAACAELARWPMRPLAAVIVAAGLLVLLTAQRARTQIRYANLSRFYDDNAQRRRLARENFPARYPWRPQDPSDRGERGLFLVG